MGVTINEIAKTAGVSRGTVDRALNNRGRIQPQVAERIRHIAEEMGYSPNVNARSLALTARHRKFGVILQFIETPFMLEVLRGIMAPSDCPLFRKACTPENPIGPCMVSSEGSCAAYYRYY